MKLGRNPSSSTLFNIENSYNNKKQLQHSYFGGKYTWKIYVVTGKKGGLEQSDKCQDLRLFGFTLVSSLNTQKENIEDRRKMEHVWTSYNDHSEDGPSIEI